MFERSLQLLLHISKRFNPFQVLKLFLLLLEVTCVIFARATNADVWQGLTFALIVSAHPYCARKSTCHAMPRHSSSARVKY